MFSFERLLKLTIIVYLTIKIKYKYLENSIVYFLCEVFFLVKVIRKLIVTD